MDRHDIIEEIRRTARDGRALGKMAFERETGIMESDLVRQILGEMVRRSR